MILGDFVVKVIDQGTEAAKRDYKGDTAAKKMKRDGSISGLDACRGKDAE